MISKITCFSLIIFLPLFQSLPYGTIWASDNSSNKGAIIIQKEQNGQTITIKVEDLIQIELPEIGSAGYKWHINNLDAQYLELISEETRKASEEVKLGVPVIRVFRLKANSPGETEIKIDHYRIWEGVRKSSDHFFIKINIIKDRR